MSHTVIMIVQLRGVMMGWICSLNRETEHFYIILVVKYFEKQL